MDNIGRQINPLMHKFVSVFQKSNSREDVKANLGPAPDSEFYKKYANRGTALIFNHEKYDNNFAEERPGTIKDGEDLKQLLLELNFHVHLYIDRSYSELLAVIKKVSAQDHSDASCILIAVMTHGDPSVLYAKDRQYAPATLWEPFSPLNCPTLAGKPKLFFIQACRGSHADPGVTLTYVETDSVNSKLEKTYKIPVMADFLFMYATFDGYVAWRNEDGSPFIQALINQIKIHRKSKDLLTILTHVNREVAIHFTSINDDPKYDQKKQMCSIVSMLIRLFYID